MNILHVIDSLRLAGAERLVCDLASHSTAIGHLAHIYAMRRDAEDLSVQPSSSSVRVFYSTVEELYSPLQTLALAEHLRRFRYDIVHVHLYPAQLWASIARRLSGSDARFITTEHNTLNRRRSWPAFRAIDACMYRQFDAVCAISEAAARGLTDWLPDECKRVSVVPNGIRLDRFRCSRARTAADSVRVISVGRCEAQKRHDLTIEAVSRFPTAMLTIVGDGPLRRELHGLAKRLRIDGRVRFTGHRNDVSDLLSDADLYVQASDYEGFGIAALEAMAAGLPVVYSDVPGLRDVVGQAGTSFEPGRVASLCAALERIIGREDTARELGRASAFRAEQFSLEACAERYLNLYESLLRRPCKAMAA